jgi:ribose/xylose/arabinose/galactoside ABC-type transport system permease subunit
MQLLGSAWGQRISIILVVAVVMIILEPRFFRISNIYSILLAIAIYGILACGMLFVILIGGIDLSIGSAAAMAGCVMTKTYIDSGYTIQGLIGGFLLAMFLCFLLGLFHGLEIVYFRMPAFVMTLATKYAIYGAMQVYTEGKYINPHVKGLYYYIGNGRPLGIPMPVVIMIVCVVICGIILGCTAYGRKCYAVGGNPAAAELVGIRSKKYTIIAYVVCSMLAGFGGIVLASLNMSVNQATANGYEGTVLMAMVIGGINIFGGEGGIPGAIYGALFVGIIDNMLILTGVPSEFQKFVQGVIIIAAIAVNMHTYRRSLGLITPRKRRAGRLPDQANSKS